MPSHVHYQVADVLDAAVPRMQQEFLMSGPLIGRLPADIRADIVRVFTQVLCRAIKDSDDGSEIGRFIENVVWESRKLGVAPSLFLTWIDHYSSTVRGLLDDEGWSVTEPMLAVARRHVERLHNN